MDGTREAAPARECRPGNLFVKEVEGMIRTRVLRGCLLFVALVAGPGTARSADNPEKGDAKDPLAPLARFVGEWVVNGKWANGTELHARSVYEWGVNKKILTAKTYVQKADG